MPDVAKRVLRSCRPVQWRLGMRVWSSAQAAWDGGILPVADQAHTGSWRALEPSDDKTLMAWLQVLYRGARCVRVCEGSVRGVCEGSV